MNKIVVAVVLVVALVLLVWALVAGIGFLWKQIPVLAGDGKQIAQNTVKITEDVFAGLQEKAKELSPVLAGKCGGIWLEKGEMSKMTSQIKQAESSLDDEFRPLFKEKKEYYDKYDKYRYKQKSTYQRIFDIFD